MSKILKFMVVVFILLVNITTMKAWAENNAAVLAGEYSCIGHDRIDKTLNFNLSIMQDAKNSIKSKGFYSYKLRVKAPKSMTIKGLPPNIMGTGSIVANGNHFALTFKNSNPKAATDQAVAIGKIRHVENYKGHHTIKLIFFSYQTNYKGGDNSFWVCTKYGQSRK